MFVCSSALFQATYLPCGPIETAFCNWVYPYFAPGGYNAVYCADWTHYIACGDRTCNIMPCGEGTVFLSSGAAASTYCDYPPQLPPAIPVLFGRRDRKWCNKMELHLQPSLMMLCIQYWQFDLIDLIDLIDWLIGSLNNTEHCFCVFNNFNKICPCLTLMYRVLSTIKAIVEYSDRGRECGLGGMGSVMAPQWGLGRTPAIEFYD